jgi:hypothetical protein
MHTNTSRAGRHTARLGLESLEGRVLLSATLPAMPTPAAAQVSSIQPLATVQAASYSYSWSISPGAVLTGTNSGTTNGKSSGSVMVALAAAGNGSATVNGSAIALPLGQFSTGGSALDSNPDRYNTPFSLTLKIRDAASGATGTLTFNGTITGTMGWNVATLHWKTSLAASFQNPTQGLTLGGHTYSVSLPGKVALGIPDDLPVKINAAVQVSPAASSQARSPSSHTTPSQASYSYRLGVIPSVVLTGTNTPNHKNTGSVKIALSRPGTGTLKVGGPAVGLTVGVVTSSSSASAAHPDSFNTPFTVDLWLKDSASGKSTTLVFKGLLTGTLTSKTSNLGLKITSPLTQVVKLGSRTYTVTLKTNWLHIPAPGATPALLGATVRVK